MCGIIGYLGTKSAIENVVDGLKNLEYRGYDSAGIAYIENEALQTVKSVGDIGALLRKIENITLPESDSQHAGIGHTRWATHGGVSEINAHPHISNDGKFAVVHNGTIENYESIKSILLTEGIELKSETDTEVIPNLVQVFFEKHNDLQTAVQNTINLLEGSFAIVLMTSHAPDILIACKRGTPPLIIGEGIGTYYISSDIPAMQTQTQKVYIMESDEIAIITKDAVYFQKDGKEVKKALITADVAEEITGKGEYSTWMEKEINDIPDVLGQLVTQYTRPNAQMSHAARLVKRAKCVHITACGTSYHAGLILGHLLEKHCGIRTKVYIASEFTHSAVLHKKDVAIVLTQSGETADTLTAMSFIKQHRIPIISLCNVELSSIARASTVNLPILAGAEFAVASTKAYCAQVLTGALLVHAIKPLCTIDEFKKLPQITKQVIEDCAQYKELAEQCAEASKIFFLGRGVDYFTALEAALKVKEITYMHCEGYAAGELKHGTLSLVDTQTHSIFFDHTLTNTAAEVHARGSQVHVLETPPTTLRFVYSVIPAQILALRISLLRGNNPDKPRNLAKSVTVE